jgi:hypothetical protein
MWISARCTMRSGRNLLDDVCELLQRIPLILSQMSHPTTVSSPQFMMALFAKCNALSLKSPLILFLMLETVCSNLALVPKTSLDFPILQAGPPVAHRKSNLIAEIQNHSSQVTAQQQRVAGYQRSQFPCQEPSQT